MVVTAELPGRTGQRRAGRRGVSAVARRSPDCFLSVSLMSFSVCLLPGELCVPTHKNPTPQPLSPQQIWCHRECWNKFLVCLIGCWRAHRQAQQNKTPGTSMSSHKHHVCEAKCLFTGHIKKNPKQSKISSADPDAALNAE